MSTSYETTTTTNSGDRIGLHTEYLRTIPGILKIVEFVLGIIVIICVSVWIGSLWGYYGAGWVQFVAIAAVICTAILFIFHFIGLINKIFGPWGLIEFIYYVAITVLYLIAAIVAAVAAGKLNDRPISGAGSPGAAAFFCFCATGVYAADTFFMFQGWRSGTTHTSSSTTTTSSTTVTVDKSGQHY